MVLWMIFIFIMSSMNETISSNQSGFFVSLIANLFNIKNIEILTTIVRKMAHFTEYFILGILVINSLDISNKRYLYSFIIGFIYAISDEIHQLFITGRSGKIFDVLIDSLGIIMSIFIYKAYKNLTKLKKWL